MAINLFNYMLIFFSIQNITTVVLYYIIISGTDFDIIEGEVSMYVKRKDAVPRHLLHFIKKGVVLIFWQLKMSVKKE